MDISKISLREQVLVLLATTIIVGGAYGAFRYYPAHKAIVDIKKNTVMMDVAIKSGKVPDEPFEDVEDLRGDLAALEAELSESQKRMQEVESRLSPADSTEVRLAISEAARNALVRISANEEYRVTVPPPVDKKATASASKSASKRLGDAAQRRARNERRAARVNGAALTVNQVSPDQANHLIRKMAINGPMERPMQRLTMEGTYSGIMEFINALEQIDQMVTIVQFQLIPTQQTPAPGYSQRLNATLVLAL
jgi:hypothetical protein